MPGWLGTFSVIALTIVLGSALQLLFWKTATRSVGEALVHNYGLWIVYFLLSAIAMARFFAFLDKRSKKPEEKE